MLRLLTQYLVLLEMTDLLDIYNMWLLRLSFMLYNYEFWFEHVTRAWFTGIVILENMTFLKPG